MNASLDTDIVIHLYMSGKKGLLFRNFDLLYMHEYLYENELKRKSIQVYQEFSKDVESGRIVIFRNKDLVDFGIKGLFDEYRRDFNYLFDCGELYAVALAKAMGLVAFVSDDTKEFGPHETLVKELIEDVIPFSFYELLFLEFLSGNLSVEDMHKEFNYVTNKTMGKYPMNFRHKILRTVRRFSKKNGTRRDYDWIEKYCENKKIVYHLKMQELKNYLHNINY